MLTKRRRKPEGGRKEAVGRDCMLETIKRSFIKSGIEEVGEEKGQDEGGLRDEEEQRNGNV